MSKNKQTHNELSAKKIILFLFLSAYCCQPLCAAGDPPLSDLYMKLLVQGVKRAIEYQSDDGRYNSSLGGKNKPALRLNLFDQMAIHPVAYLYKTAHPLNPFFGDKRLLDSAVRCGDLLLKYESQTIWPMEDWTLCAWLETWDLLKDSLSEEQNLAWKKRIEHWVGYYVNYVERSRGKRNYTAMELGTSPNHYSLYMVTLLRAGQVLGHPEWADLARQEFKNILRTQHPDGYWAEHDGPVNAYHRITTHGVGIYYALSSDPEALEALRRAKNFTLGFTYPDGSLASVIDERNRYSPGIRADWGLMALSHFPDGRRFNRLMLQKAIHSLEKSDRNKGESEIHEESYSLSSMTLSRILDDLRYSASGPESPAPQELDRYEARLMSGAVLLRRGSWVICLSGIISPPWEGNRYFLDRYTYLEIWHEKTGLLIGGGNTKRQPQIAGLLMEPSNSGLDFWPQESRITTSGDTIQLELRFQKFRAGLKAVIIDNQTLKFKAFFKETTPPVLWPNRYESNLQLQLKPGDKILLGNGETTTLSTEKTDLLEEQIGSSLDSDLWRLEVPEMKTSLRFPFLPFFNYNIDGIGGPGTAVAILSSYTDSPENALEYLLKIK